MDSKNEILDSWIMVEQLSEGEIKKKDIERYYYIENDFYSNISCRIDKEQLKDHKKSGFIFYIDIFELEEIIKVLREKSGWITPEEKPDYGIRFSLALCFSVDFEFLSDMTFYTACGFIKHENKLPILEELVKAEDKIKTKYKTLFEECFKYIDTDDNGDSSEDSHTNASKKRILDPTMFNSAIISVMSDYKTDVDSCRFLLVENVESKAANMHSFYIEDLNKAKKITNLNLDNYLLSGETGRRINLDSDNRVDSFSNIILETILEPKNYPLGRFPSKTINHLYLMQQATVNLSVGYDESQIRSVNGPPGSGKTTLLKDIFAELIVKQAYEICKLDGKYIKATNDLVFFNEAKLARLPQSIAENGIVVASSNNSAVQNIVNEIPLANKIDKELIGELRDADYFYNIANILITYKYKKGKNELPAKEERWGLFSLEGGKFENRQSLITYLRKVIEELGDLKKKIECENDSDIYNSFISEYEAVFNMRNKIQKIAETSKRLQNNKNNLELMKKDFIEENTRREIALKNAINEAKLRINGRKKTVAELESELTNKKSELEITITNKGTAINTLQVLKTPRVVALFKTLFIRDFRNNVSSIEKTLTELTNKELGLNSEISKLGNQIADLIAQNEIDVKSIQSEELDLNNWIQEELRKQNELEKAIQTAETTIRESKVEIYNPDQIYDDFQKSNPWFDERYRKVQSRLFITALRVRKQFLLENLKHVKNAVNIWDSQSSNPYKPEVIEAAWEWINLVIPVISTTFASFGQMFKVLGKNSIGHLFIDEAGQAIPQAAVGAIFRSKNVMVVGDPAQIKPVYNLEPSILYEIGQSIGVSDVYLSDSVSVQSLADRASRYGYYKDEDSWVGIPLWVHRRCNRPMFDISNKLSYNNLMVQAEPKLGFSGWYDIKGIANDKYVEEQGNKLYELISERIKKDKKIIDKDNEDIIYVISPFKNVAEKLAIKLKDLDFVRKDNEDNPTNIGTIHTFQGKEAPIVYLVLGADDNSRGAATWAVSEPNMMNVAASRAKEEFYIIGDRELYEELKTPVILDTLAILDNYKKEHPDKSI